MGTSYTRLQIVNATDTDIINTAVTGVDNFDYIGNERPDRNFVGVFIGAKKSAERGLKLRKVASNCPFIMTLKFRDGTEDVFRINQKNAIGGAHNFMHTTRSHDLYHDRVEGNMIKISVVNTERQTQNQTAKNLNKEGEALVAQYQYESAVAKFQEASKLANEADTVDSIEANHAGVLNHLGKSLTQQAWDLEADTAQDKSEEAKRKFEEAKTRLQQAEDVRHSSEQDLRSVEVKIEGNRLFNEANELEAEAYQLFEEARNSGVFDNYEASKNKYEETLSKYQEAREKFDEGAKGGDGRFEAASKLTNEQIEGVLKVMDDIDKAELKHNINRVNLDEVDDEEKKEDRVDFGEAIKVIDHDFQELIKV